MDKGNWVPLSKAFLKSLPTDRPFTQLEAAFSLQVAVDCKQDVSVSGLSARWGWSWKRASTFIKNMGGEIEYQSETKQLQNQHGKMCVKNSEDKAKIGRRYGEDKAKMRLIDSSNLRELERRYSEDRAKIERRQGMTISNPNPNPNPSLKDLPVFDEENNAGASAPKVKKGRVFVQPSLAEVESYCLERKNSVKPQSWIDHYLSNGWMVGKTKMKDWKACIRTWERNSFNNSNGGESKHRPQQMTPRQAYMVDVVNLNKKMNEARNENLLGISAEDHG